MNQSKYIIEFNKGKFSNELFFNKFRSIRSKHVYVRFSTLPDALIYEAILAQYVKQKFMNEKNDAFRSLKQLQTAVSLVSTGLL